MSTVTFVNDVTIVNKGLVPAHMGNSPFRVSSLWTGLKAGFRRDNGVAPERVRHFNLPILHFIAASRLLLQRSMGN